MNFRRLSLFLAWGGLAVAACGGAEGVKEPVDAGLDGVTADGGMAAANEGQEGAALGDGQEGTGPVEGAEGLPPEGPEGTAEGPEGGAEGPEAAEGVEGIEGGEGGEGSEGKEGAEGQEQPCEANPEAQTIDDVCVNATLKLPGLKGRVDVVYDEWGVPHIYAETIHDVMFGNGYVMAQDRYFQMEMARRFAKGELAAITGASSLADDVENRFWRMGSVGAQIDAAVEQGSEARIALDAFAAGVNAFTAEVAANGPPERLGVEFLVLGAAPEDLEPWTAADSLAIGRLQSYSLSNGYISELDLAVNKSRLRAQFKAGNNREGLDEDLYPLLPAAPTAIIDYFPAEGGGTHAAVTAEGEAREQKLRRYRETRPRLNGHSRLWESAVARFARLAQSPYNWFGIGNPSNGSNNWAVHAIQSETGNALLANDPHLQLSNPAIFYEVHLNTRKRGGALNVRGIGFPGIPGVILGHNERIAWGATTHASDVIDHWAEELVRDKDGAPVAVKFNGGERAIEARSEIFKVKKDVGEDDCVKLVEKNVDSEFLDQHAHQIIDRETYCEFQVTYYDVPGHGTISALDEETAISTRWTGFEPTSEAATFMQVAAASNLPEFEDALDAFGVGAQNFMYADVEGNIFWSASSLFPVREKLDPENPPWLPMPGTGGYEWTGEYLSDELQPHAVNPPKGFIVTANNAPVPNTLDGDPLNEAVNEGKPYYGYYYAEGYRAQRITARLANDTKERPQGTKLTLDDMMLIQGDAHSNVGEAFRGLIFEAMTVAKAAKEGSPEADSRLAGYYNARAQEAEKYLQDWTLMAAAGTEKDAPATAINDSVATSIFNMWLQHFIAYTLGDEMSTANISMSKHQAINVMVHICFRPEKLISSLANDGHSIAFDNLETAELETRDLVIMRALNDALDALAALPEFASPDMQTWRWGKIHRVTLKHLSGEALFDIPGASDPEFPGGFPRHGDLFNVDVGDYGLATKSVKTDFTSSSGAAMRFVIEMDPSRVKARIALPGGQSAHAASGHADDQMRKLWVRNAYHEAWYYEDDVASHATRRVVLQAP